MNRIYLIGNLLMDVGIAFFVIFSAFEAWFHRRARLLEYDIKMKKEFTGKKSQEVTEDEYKALWLRTRASKWNPYEKYRPFIFFTIFFTGIILEIIGILID